MVVLWPVKEPLLSTQIILFLPIFSSPYLGIKKKYNLDSCATYLTPAKNDISTEEYAATVERTSAGNWREIVEASWLIDNRIFTDGSSKFSPRVKTETTLVSYKLEIFLRFLAIVGEMLRSCVIDKYRCIGKGKVLRKKTLRRVQLVYWKFHTETPWKNHSHYIFPIIYWYNLFSLQSFIES